MRNCSKKLWRVWESNSHSRNRGRAVGGLHCETNTLYSLGTPQRTVRARIYNHLP